MSDGPFIDPGNSEPVPDAGPEPNPDADMLPPLDISALHVTDAASEDFAVPNADASKEPRRPLFPRRERSQRDTGRTRTTRPKAVPKTRPGQLVQPLEDIYTTIGALLSPFDPVCGSAVIQSANNCARTLDDLAQRNDAVRRVLLALTTTSAIGAVAVAHAPIALAVATHHVPAVSALQGDILARAAESFANAEHTATPGEQGDQPQ